MQAYQSLEKIFTSVYRYTHLLALASWDSQVNSPPNTFDARGLAIAELENHVHNLATSEQVHAWLAEAEAAAGNDANTHSDVLSQMQRANLREMRRRVMMESCLPADLLSRKTVLTTTAQATWARSREENNFALFLPTLEQLVALAREEGSYRRAALPEAQRAMVTPYETLVNVFEPGMTVARLDSIFSDVKTWLPGLLRDALARQAEEDADKGPLPKLNGPFPVDNQEALSRHVMEHVWKFDFTRGRLDSSAHPFTGNVKEDCRVTTNCTESNFTKSLLAVIHETGHAKYEMNMGPRDMTTQPICEARSLGIHESQSLFAEKMIGRSAGFVSFLLPLLKQFFPNPPGLEGDTEISALTEDGLRRVMQRVQPSPIRVDADEVCYPLHIILRYEMEKALLDGSLEAKDVPKVWNAKMKEYLNVDTEGRDDLGCLQDIHWAGGAFGYFPTYSLGAMFAAQLMASIKKDIGARVVEDAISNGDLLCIFDEQRERIWKHGSTFETEELMRQATGEPLNPKYFREHLERRYLRRED